MGNSSEEDLAHRVLKDIKAPSDLGLLRCVQCGLCTSMCPASRHSEYDAREIIKRVLDNDESLKVSYNFYCCINITISIKTFL